MEWTSHSLLTVVFDQGVEPDVMELLERLGLDHFTKFTDVSGAGETGRHEGDPIWPGLNTMLLLYMETGRVDEFVERMHAIRDSFPVTPGMKIIVTPAIMH
jgi:hypothetical protein